MATSKSGSSQGMEDNLKKAVTEMLVRDMYAGELLQNLEQRSGGALSIVFPYAVLYRLIGFGYITEAYKKIAPDGRRRQYYQITDEGRRHVAELTGLYTRFSGGVQRILEGGGSDGN